MQNVDFQKFLFPISFYSARYYKRERRIEDRRRRENHFQTHTSPHFLIKRTCINLGEEKRSTDIRETKRTQIKQNNTAQFI